jgi:hypothetical protein
MKVLKTRFTDTVTYQLRYVILYIIIGALLLGSIIAMPELTGMRLSDAERASTVISMNSDLTLANFPYHLLQGLSIRLLGLTPLAVKLPSLVLGVITAVLLTLLLNRWYRNLTAFTTATLVIASVAFLGLTSTGTADILYLLFPVLMLWLGSQIIDEKPKIITVAALAVTAIISLFIPYMIYFNVALFFLVVSHPHLRFNLRRIPKTAAIIAVIVAAVVVVPLMFFVEGFNFIEFTGPNLQLAENAATSWKYIGGFNEPLSWFSLPVLALALIGVYATILDHHIARNQIVVVLIIVTALASLFWPPLFTIAILLIAILAGNGLSFLIKNWRGIFPHNPYATLIALMPLVAFCLLIAVGSISFFHIAPRTISSVHYAGDTDFQLLDANLEGGDTLLLSDHVDFYRRAFPDHDVVGGGEVNGSRIVSDRPIATSRRLERIVTNGSATEAARFYIYR